MTKYLQEVEFQELFLEKKVAAGEGHNLPILSCTIEGIKNQNERFNKQIASKDNSGYLIAERGEIVLSPLNLWMGGIGMQDICDKGVVSPAYKVFVVNKQRIHSYFAKYLVRSNELLKLYGDVSSSGASIVRRNLDLDLLKKSTVLIPYLNEQKKIAEILTSVDRVIELTSLEIDKLKDLKKGMMQELLTKGIGHTKFKDSPVGKIPESWEVCELDKLISYSAFGPRFSSEEYAVEGNYRLFRTTDINDEWEINYESMPIANLLDPGFKNHILLDGDLQVTRSGTIGVVTVFKKEFSDRDTIPGAFLINLRVIKKRITPMFLKLFLMSNNGQFQIKKLSAGGVQQNLSGTNLKQLLVPVPPIKEQDYLVELLDAVLNRILLQKRRLAHMELLKKGLMNDLLTGKVRVKV